MDFNGSNWARAREGKSENKIKSRDNFVAVEMEKKKTKLVFD